MVTLKKRNERGIVIGDSHHRATLSDDQIDMLLNLRDEDPKRWSYLALARAFDCSKSAVAFYIKGERRGQTVAALKPVRPERRAASAAGVLNEAQGAY